MRNNFLMWTVASCAVFGLFSGSVSAYTGEQYADQAKITIQQAKRRAQLEVDGRIEKAVLEREKGGSGLRYSFDINSKSGLREIGIDAKTGKVLENSVESWNEELREQKTEHDSANGENSAAR